MRFTDNIARTLAAAAAIFLIAACSSPSDTSRITSVETSIILPAPTPLPGPAELSDGTVWVLEFLHDKPLVENTFITLSVKADRFGGSAGCNSYGGRSEGWSSHRQSRRSILDSADREYCHGLSACRHH